MIFVIEPILDISIILIVLLKFNQMRIEKKLPFKIQKK